MSFRTIFSRVLIMLLSIFLLFSATDSALAYFDALSNNEDQTIELGDWPFGIPIYTAQEFYDFATAATSLTTDRYYLANDIDFTGFTWDYNSSFNSNIFKGKFDGNNQTLSNITMTSTDTSSVTFSIFSQMEGATIKNVVIEDFNMGFDSTYFYATPLESATLVSFVKGTNNLIENITLDNVEVIGNSLNGAGGLVTQVAANADLTVRNVKATNVTVLNTSKRAGGIISRVIAGTGTVIIEDIDFQGFLGADNRISNTGGILGTAQNTLINISRVIVEYTAEGTINLSDTAITIKSDRYSGGILGNNNSTQLTITDSFYTGTLYNVAKYMGAMVGRNKQSATLVNSHYSNVTFLNTTVAPTSTTGIHGIMVNETTMPNVAWWNNFALQYTTVNALWTQDVSGRLELIRY